MTERTTLSRLPVHGRERLARVPEQLYDEALRNVIRVSGPFSDEEAMKIVDAVLGPLKLVPPKPEHYELCDHARFTHGGQWLLCNEEHEEPDGYHSMTHPDLEDGCEEWRAGDPDGRSFVPLNEAPSE